MKMLGERFCQAVSECLEQDGLIVIVGRFEFLQLDFDAQSRGYGEQANMIFEAALFGGDVISQATIGASLLPCLFAGGENSE